MDTSGPATRIAVVGGATYMGANLAAQLTANPDVEKVLLIDSVMPAANIQRRFQGAEFIAVEYQSPALVVALQRHRIDTVVYVGMHQNMRDAVARKAQKENNILGSMHVIGACLRVSTLRHIIMQSSASIYGASGADPALFTEDMQARTRPKGGTALDFVTVEGYMRGVRRKRPEVSITILRMASMLGSTGSHTLSDVLSPSIAPMVAGYDPRVQLLHPDDAVSALAHACTHEAAPTLRVFNIAGEGIMTLGCAIARTGRIPLWIPAPLYPLVFARFRTTHHTITTAMVSYLKYGRGLDLRRMREEFGFIPRYSTDEALAAFVESAELEPLYTREAMEKSAYKLAASLHPTWAEDLADKYSEVAKMRSRETLAQANDAYADTMTIHDGPHT